MKSNFILAFLVFYPFLGGFLAWLAGNYGEALLQKAGGRQIAPGGKRESGKESNGSAGAKLGKLFGNKLGIDNNACRDYVANFIVISEFLVMAILFARYASAAGEGAVAACRIPGICGFGLSFTLDGFRLIYGAVACLMWMMTTILSRQYFAHHHNRNRFYMFLLLTFGATMGVFLSADLYTTFIFFEIMSFTSYVWVAQEENAPSLRAALTYLAVAVIGGLVMLMGLFLVYHELGTLEMAKLLPAAREYLGNAAEGSAVSGKNALVSGASIVMTVEGRRALLYAAGACMLFGFGAKAGAFPLHIWLPKAHPVAPAPASALLSGILTKTGVFGVLVTTSGLFLHDKTWGSLILAIGVLTMFGGALLAVFSIDLKRTLACSSMSQIGFILVGVGMQCLLGEENALAVRGTLLHMVNHSMIKLVLFMAAGVIFMNTHALDLNEVRGYGRKKPLLKAIFLVGALAIGGIPLFGGYISKTLLHESIVEYGGGWIMRAVEYIFLFSGGLTVAYMTKLFVAIFVERNESAERQRKYDAQKDYMNGASTFALAGSAAVLLVWGLFPHGIMDRAAGLGQGLMQLEEFGHVVDYFSFKNLSGAMISIAIGAVVYLFVIRKVLMRQEENGIVAKGKRTNESAAYVDLWPTWLDLENLIYRPLLLDFLPSVFGVVCSFLDRLLETLLHFVLPISGVLCRVMDSFVDLTVVALRKTIYRDSPLPHERPEGNVVTAMLGHVMNFWQGIANHTWRRHKPAHKDYVHILAVRNTALKENNTIIGRSLSFALLMFGSGLCLTLIYILWW